MNYQAECDTPPRWKRVMRSIFPARFLDVDYSIPPEPGFVPGEFMTGVTLVFDWRDRLRLLVSGGVAVEVRTATDVIVDKAKSRSTFYVLAPGDVSERIKLK